MNNNVYPSFIPSFFLKNFVFIVVVDTVYFWYVSHYTRGIHKLIVLVKTMICLTPSLPGIRSTSSQYLRSCPKPLCDPIPIMLSFFPVMFLLMCTALKNMLFEFEKWAVRINLDTKGTYSVATARWRVGGRHATRNPWMSFSANLRKLQNPQPIGAHGGGRETALRNRRLSNIGLSDRPGICISYWKQKWHGVACF